MHGILFRNLQYLNKITISDLRLATKNTTWIALPHVCGGGRPQLVGTFDQLEFRPIAQDTCFDEFCSKCLDILRSLPRQPVQVPSTRTLYRITLTTHHTPTQNV